MARTSAGSHRTLYFFARQSVRLWVGAFLLWCGGVLAFISGASLLDERRYRDEARTARAEVVGKAMQPATADTGTRYEITYRLTLPNGARAQRTDTVDVAVWERLERGSAVAVQYLPDDGESLRLARAPKIAMNAIPLAIGAVLAPIGLFLFAGGARDVRRKLRLSRHGAPAEATVLSVEATNVRINRKPQWRIRFRYRDRAGEEREGTSGYLPASQAHEWKRGDVGRVHIDPDGQDQALWIGEPPAAT